MGLERATSLTRYASLTIPFEPHSITLFAIVEASMMCAAAPAHYFRIRSGVVIESSQTGPVASIDRLYLVNASGLPAFRPVYETFSRMGFYSLNPDRIRDLQSPDAGELLARDGSNITSVLAQLTKHNHSRKRRIEEYLSRVVPGVHGVDVKVV